MVMSWVKVRVRVFGSVYRNRLRYLTPNLKRNPNLILTPNQTLNLP